MSETTPSPRPGAPEAGLLLKPPGSTRQPRPDMASPTTERPASSMPSGPDLPPPASGRTIPPGSEELGSPAGYTDGPPDASSPETASSSPTSTSRRRPPLVDPDLFADDFAQAVGALGQMANERFAPAGSAAWLTTQDEERGVGEPAARMLSRRLPDVLARLIGSGPDAEDAVQAALTLGRYAVRQFRLRMEERRRRRAAATPVDEKLNPEGQTT